MNSMQRKPNKSLTQLQILLFQWNYMEIIMSVRYLFLSLLVIIVLLREVFFIVFYFCRPYVWRNSKSIFTYRILFALDCWGIIASSCFCNIPTAPARWHANLIYMKQIHHQENNIFLYLYSKEVVLLKCCLFS